MTTPLAQHRAREALLAARRATEAGRRARQFARSQPREHAARVLAPTRIHYLASTTGRPA